MNWSSEYTLDDINDLILRSEDYAKPREREFLTSCKNMLSEGRTLSFSQERWVSAINSKYTPENIDKEKQWIKDFGEDQRKIARQVAEYYQFNPPYFENLVYKILSSPDKFFLSREDWNKFCENKYALKIRQLYKQPPKFKEADCVQIRSKNKIPLASKGVSRLKVPKANQVGFILEVNARPITRHAKGSRVYKVLLSGEPVPIYAHESDLKRKR